MTLATTESTRPSQHSDQSSDGDVFDAAAALVAHPKREPGDSFILHAPLELLARRALLTMAAHDGRDAILARIAEVGAEYAAWGTELERTPAAPASVGDDPVGFLVRAIERSDDDAVDDAVAWMVRHFDVDELVAAFAGPVLPSLAAAAHGSIFLYLLPRVAARSLPAASMARSTVHELARHPDWRLTWYERDLPAAPTDAAERLAARLVRPIAREHPASHFIFPTMDVTERTGLAADTLGDLVGGLSVPDARRTLLRVAAQSMLQDDPAHAPYGWSHCLTMPQAALGIAHRLDDPTAAVAVAGTYVVGFRSTLGSHDVHLDWAPSPRRVAVHELAAAAEPASAAAAAWHAERDDRPAIWRVLAGHAAAHHDAHLAKYTLACADAARADPDAAHLFLAAAAFLNAWWAERDR